jgi:L-histidine Nalpha-methyltransferase
VTTPAATGPAAATGPGAGGSHLGFYPGSSIGNFEPQEARTLLEQFRRLLGPGGLLLIGVDQPKTVERLEAAYNDRAGVSAAFARNLLVRLNRDLDGSLRAGGLPLRGHAGRAKQNRIAMALVSCKAQQVQLAGRHWPVPGRRRADHGIQREVQPGRPLRSWPSSAGWQPLQRWSDPQGDLSLHLLAQADST